MNRFNLCRVLSLSSLKFGRSQYGRDWNGHSFGIEMEEEKTQAEKADADRNSGHEECLLTYTVDSFANGISFGQHRLDKGQRREDFYILRINDDSELIRLRSRYAIHKENPLHELEGHLMRLSRQGLLRSAVIYLGVTTDPFLPFIPPL